MAGFVRNRVGAGSLLLDGLIAAAAAAAAGLWKLLSRIFVENAASQLDDVWRDVVIVERLIPANM